MARKGRPVTRDQEDIDNLKNVNFRADKEFVKALRIFCIQNDVSMQDFIKEAIEEKMSRMKAKK